MFLVSLAALLVVAVPLAAGAAIPGRDLGWPTRWFTGLLGTALLILILRGVGVPIDAAAVVALAAVAALFGLVIRRARRSPWPRPSWPELAFPVAVGLFLALPLAAVLLGTARDPVSSWDAVRVWYSKTRHLYRGAPLDGVSPVPNYPCLGPLLWTLVQKLVGLANESIGRCLFPLTYFVWLAALLDGFGRPYRIGTALALAVVSLCGLNLEAATNGNQDWLVSTVAGFGALMIVRLSQRPALDGPEARRDLALAGFLCGAVGLVKNEGAILGLILAASFFAVELGHRHPRRWPAFLKATLPFSAVLVGTALIWPLLVVANRVDVTKLQGDAFSWQSVVFAFRSFDRWPAIRPYFDAHIQTQRALWTAAAPATVVALVLVPAIRKALVVLWASIALHLAFVLWVFFSTRQDLAWHLRTAFERVSSQGSSLSLLVAFVSAAATANALSDRRAQPEGVGEGDHHQRV